LSLDRILGVALVALVLVPLVACDEETSVEPPPPDKQIPLVRHYTKKTVGNQQVGLQSNDVYEILVTSNDALWVGNQGGVAVYGNMEETVRTAAFDQNTKGFPNPKVRAMVESNGLLYVGTWGGGIGVYDIAAGTWQEDVLDTDDGLINDLVSDIKVDDDGALIIGTNGGVSRYDPATGRFGTFRKLGVIRVGDLLDDFVSAVEIANTPRGKEYWYMPRWESGIDPGTEDQHGITVARGTFDASETLDTLAAILDNTLYEDNDGALSNGAGEQMFAGRAAGGKQHRALVKFSVANVVPDDATILSAALRLRSTSLGFVSSNITLHRALKEWGEGTSDAAGDEQAGAPATNGDATWKHAVYPDDEWDQLGGDFTDDVSGGREIRGGGAYEISSAGVTRDVQNWARATLENNGWVVASSDTVKRYATRENSNPSWRPALIIRHARFMYFTEVTTAFPEPNVNDVLYDEANDLFYIAFSTQGIGVVDVGAATWRFLTTDDGLPSNVIYSIAKVDGVLWAGTQDGLARQRADGSFQGYDRGGGIPASRVRRVYSDDPERLWLGLVEAGAALVDPTRAEL
jgi:hypothetical protein